MTRAALLVPALLLAACGGSRGPMTVSTAPAYESGQAVVEQFMGAVVDSNLTRMGQLWGTSRGPAAVTGDPSDWQRRIVAMQAWLKGGTSRVLGEDRTADDNRRTVTLELTRGGCARQVPFHVLRLSNGSWIVWNVDLEAAGNPARPCNEP
jgi:hypothetical protein